MSDDSPQSDISDTSDTDAEEAVTGSTFVDDGILGVNSHDVEKMEPSAVQVTSQSETDNNQAFRSAPE